MNALDFGVRRSKSGSSNEGGGIQYLVTHIEFRVSCSVSS